MRVFSAVLMFTALSTSNAVADSPLTDGAFEHLFYQAAHDALNDEPMVVNSPVPPARPKFSSAFEAQVRAAVSKAVAEYDEGHELSVVVPSERPHTPVKNP